MKPCRCNKKRIAELEAEVAKLRGEVTIARGQGYESGKSQAREMAIALISKHFSNEWSAVDVLRELRNA